MMLVIFCLMNASPHVDLNELGTLFFLTLLTPKLLAMMIRFLLHFLFNLCMIMRRRRKSLLPFLFDIDPASWNLLGKMRGVNHTMPRILRLLSVQIPTVLMMKMMFPLQSSNNTQRSVKRVHQKRNSPWHQRQ